MTEFSAAVYQNEYLADGSTDVHAIVTLECRGAGQAGQTARATPARSSSSTRPGSMDWPGVRAAQAAAAAALDQVIDGDWFALIAGTHVARLVFPYGARRWAWRR